jgi:hypothetical protein
VALEVELDAPLRMVSGVCPIKPPMSIDKHERMERQKFRGGASPPVRIRGSQRLYLHDNDDKRGATTPLTRAEDGAVLGRAGAEDGSGSKTGT